MNLRELLKEIAASGGSSTTGPSGPGTLKSNGVFIGNQTPEQKHDYTAKSVIGKGIEWTKPTTSTEHSQINKEDEIETHSEHHGDHVGDAVTEDAEATSTVSGDIAHVAYPLFVGGKSKRQKRRNARAAVGQGYNAGPVGVGTGVYENEIGEAHALDHQNVIYRLDKDKPMSDTEVLVLGGAGRYSLEGLRMKARREARALAQDLEIEHGGAFRRSAENVKQLANTLNTIVAAYNELKRIRQKGGRGSRGITDEDANFIRECYGIAQRWTQRFSLIENNKTGN